MPRRGVIAVLATLLALLAVPTAVAHSSVDPLKPADSGHSEVGHYVGLGDSFASGPFVQPQRLDPLGCLRSARNYAGLIAQQLDVAEFTDMSCGMATTEHMTTAQPVPLGSNRPQFDALRPDTDLVTVTIGGNDMGFTDIVMTCGELSMTDPLGNPCERHATADGSDRYHERIRETEPKVAAVLQGIQQRAPDATVVLVSYLRILPPEGGCWPVVPISRGDVPYLDGVQQELNTMLARQAQAQGTMFVDAYEPSLGRDTCQPPGVRWVEGMVPTSVAWPVHPNAEGMRAVADFILDELAAVSD